MRRKVFSALRRLNYEEAEEGRLSEKVLVRVAGQGTLLLQEPRRLEAQRYAESRWRVYQNRS